MNAAIILLAALGASSDVVLLDFTAEWCGPCRRMKPLLQKLHGEGFNIREVDVDRYKGLASKYGINSIPAFVLVVRNQEIGRITGSTSESELRRLLAKAPAPREDSFVSAPDPRRAAPQSRPQNSPFSETTPSRTNPRNEFAGNNSRTQPMRQPQREPANVDFASLASNTPPTADRPIVRGQSFEEVTAPEAVERDPLKTAVRIRVRDSKGVNFGSGTVIYSTSGQSLIATCGHIFRGFHAESRIEVDIFRSGKSETIPGSLVRYDDESADVGIIAVSTSQPLPVARIAGAAQQTKQGAHVFSVGCDNGEAPTKLQHSVTRMNPYQGADTTECTGIPIKGRSGGGLFDTSGRLIGVCIAADRDRGRGVYAGLKEIHAILDESQLTALYHGTADGNPNFELANANSELPFGENPNHVSSGNTNPTSGAIASTADDSPFGRLMKDAEHMAREEAPPVALASNDSTNELPAGLEAGEPMEVICIIRRPGATEDEKQVVVINRASPKFVKYLKGELSGTPRQNLNKFSLEHTSGNQKSDERANANAFDSNFNRSPDPTSGRLERYVRSEESRVQR
ncbi:trypsin-like peptidase domain-containing protein [Calycomorphotria hydatis]|uniref:Thioredoxin n=1 Tax=Calycomorphotria hydatis TaxID=2528027 RepID=A0A517TCK6_9PLAN|nr:trypsin-like peptidase domain-containing protein [Calycomorphotria hydatis]QDT66102.1 Thioredoxin [Calycomorphotria hydatis]